MYKSLFSAAAAVGFLTMSAVPTFSQTAPVDPVPGHPRVNEVDQRLQNQQNRIDNGVASGKINARQEARDTNVDNRVARQLSADEAKNGGHITKREDAQLNKELNKNSARIYDQKHPG